MGFSLIQPLQGKLQSRAAITDTLNVQETLNAQRPIQLVKRSALDVKTRYEDLGGGISSTG
jgi:hypothetical protein